MTEGNHNQPSESKQKNQFEAAAKAARSTLVGEFMSFVRDNQKWVLLPLLVVLLLALGLVLLGSTGAAPFIYTVF
jgi:hypothetical protein